LLIAGKSWKNDFSYYKKIIDKYNLSQHIILHNNFIPHNDVKYYYSAADLVVLPYKKIYQSGVLMMTLSYQKPALVSDLDPLNEIIEDGKNGFVFKSEDHDSLFNKLDNIFSEKYDMRQINLNANLKIKNEFDWTNIGRLTKKAYQSL
jgi:glycosyltransferase involved in cell wall biosynthesis